MNFLTYFLDNFLNSVPLSSKFLNWSNEAAPGLSKIVLLILFCFLFKIENTNSYQLAGLIISVIGVFAIITRLDLNILLTLSFNIGDI